MPLGRTTKLEAVNIALESAQITPVESLQSTDTDVDAKLAIRMLDEITVEVLTRGWYWNYQTLTYTPDTNGEIILGDNVLKADALDPCLQVVQRGLKLYNLETNSFIFENPVELRLVLILDFEEVPQSARRYITMKTARLFQERILGDGNLDTYIRSEEQQAWAQMVKEDISVSDYNHIMQGPTSRMVVNRVYPRTRGLIRRGRYM